MKPPFIVGFTISETAALELGYGRDDLFAERF
jgi:hypothetical protein